VRTEGFWQLSLADGRQVQARTLVNAAGAWADQIADLCRVPRIGLEPRRRSAFTFAAPEGIDCAAWPAVVGIDESFYFKPDAGQLLGSPANADPVAPQDVVPEEFDIALGIHHIENATTLSIRRPSHTWAGLRSFAPDGDFVLGWEERCEGFFWLAGQGGYGIQTAAGASELAAALLHHEAPPAQLLAHGVDPLAFRPGRLR
jgi:D-arginine dehydrogenase